MYVDGSPFEVIVHIVFSHDGRSQAQVEAQRSGIETEDAGAHGQGGFSSLPLHALDNHSPDALFLEAGVHGDINEVERLFVLRHPYTPHRLSVEQNEVVAEVSVRLRVRRHLQAKPHTEKVLPLVGVNGSQGKLGAANGRVKLVEEDLVNGAARGELQVWARRSLMCFRVGY